MMDDGSVENVYKEFWFPLETCNEKACKQEIVSIFTPDGASWIKIWDAGCHRVRWTDQQGPTEFQAWGKPQILKKRASDLKRSALRHDVDYLWLRGFTFYGEIL